MVSHEGVLWSARVSDAYVTRLMRMSCLMRMSRVLSACHARCYHHDTIIYHPPHSVRALLVMTSVTNLSHHLQRD